MSEGRFITRMCGAACFCIALAPAITTADQVDPIRMEATEQKLLNDKLPDGGLPAAIGVANIEVFRASRAAADIADGNGWTYNHHVDLACWSGRLCIAWENGLKDEDTWPARELFSTSADGYSWSKPAELFPPGVGNPLRMYFFHSSNGRMLTIAARRVMRGKMTKPTEGGVVVRELSADFTLGPIYTLILCGPMNGAPAPYQAGPDKEFVKACDELLANHLYLEQQDGGALLGDRRMKPYDGAPKDFGKAFCFFHQSDGTLIGIAKKAYVVESHDEGKIWTGPTRLESFKGGTAKEWIQQTSDGNFAWAHDPFPADRFPLVVLTSPDGITFDDMRVIHGEVPRQRYAGLNKNIGPQYVHGIASWANDGSRADAAMWLAYSVNKEDIWVSRVPVPIRGEAADRVADRFAKFPTGGIVPGWNTYRPKWASVAIVEDQPDEGCLRLEDHDPYDYARADRVFPAASKITTTFDLKAKQFGPRTFAIELWSEFGDVRPVRISITPDGNIETATDSDANLQIGRCDLNQWMTFKIDADTKSGKFSVTFNGVAIAANLPLAEKADIFQKLVFRTGEYRTLPTRGDEVPADSDKPAESSEYLLRSVMIQ